MRRFAESRLAGVGARWRVSSRRCVLIALAAVGLAGSPANAIEITVDYTYDTNGFFTGNTEGMAALEAAAGRLSSIIDSSLGAVSLTDNSRDDRIGFTHPGTGASFDVSPAVSMATDALAGTAVADEYRGAWSVAADEWILYAGGRSLPSAAVGGTGTGLNFTSVFDDGSSILNRGFRASGSVSNLPVWGGSISFDNDGGTTWHFDHTTASGSGSTDFYTIALHEIAHALGLSADWDEWDDNVDAGVFEGANAVAAYNADNGASVTGLSQETLTSRHWAEDTYDSFIFPLAGPNTEGTVGLGVLQDLIMEPEADLVSPRRLELTNVDVGALEDIGWSVVIPEPASMALLLGGGALMLSRRRVVS